MNSKALTTARVWASLGALLPAYAVGAEVYAPPDHPLMSDRFVMTAGLSRSESNVTANLNTGRVGLGTFIDFEDDLGLNKDNTIGMFTFGMRIAERWRLDAEYFRLDRDNDEQISRTLVWGPLSIPLNATVSSSFNVEDFRISLGYSFFRRIDKEVGVGLGAHVMTLDARLSVPNLRSESASLESTPLPVFILYARMALTDRWLLNVRVDRLSLDTGDIDGSILSSNVEFLYQPWRHVNVGLGYRDINLEVSSTSEKWRGKAQVRQSGPVLFVGATF